MPACRPVEGGAGRPIMATGFAVATRRQEIAQ